MTCNKCGEKPKKACGAFPRAVIEIDNPEKIVLLRKVMVPASMGDDTAVPPAIGKYKNVLLYYEANQKSYLYSSDGVPTQLVNGVTDYEAAINLPQINGHTLIGDKTGDQLDLQDKLTAGANISIDSDNVISAVDTTYGPATDTEIGLVKPGDGLEVASDGTLSISEVEQYAHFFDTVADMKTATNLQAGDYARTSGFYSLNDGGGAIYKISNTQPSIFYEELSNDLYAQLIPVDRKINVLQFGISNKENYDSDFAKLALYVNANNIEEVDFNNEIYNVTNYTAFDVSATSFKMNFNGGTIKLNSSFSYYNYGIFTINMDKDKDTKCCIVNGNFDGSGNPADFSIDNIHPKGGRGMFFINGARNIEADHLNFNDWFYSACIWSHYCKTGNFTNIKGVRVGGRSADNTEDARGDALYFGRVGVVEDNDNNIDPDNSYPVDINIKNCQFSSWEAIPTMYPNAGATEGRNGCKSGRAGVVLGEYSRTNARKVFNISDCYFYNYQRTLHMENVYDLDVNVENTTFSEYGQVLIGVNNDRYNNVKFNNCIFNKTIDVIAIYDSYKCIVSGFTTNNWKRLEFKNCNINDVYDGLILYGSDIDVTFNDCNIDMELFYVNNSYAKFYNSNIKYNRSNFYQSEYLFSDCSIEGCYKHDTNSKSILYATTGTNAVYNKVLRCRLKNVGFHQGGSTGRKVEISNNFLEYDSNYVNIDYSGATRNYFLSMYGDRLEKFDGNIVNNTNSTVYALMDVSNNGSFVISNNVLTNVRAGLTNGTGYKAIFRNNKFVSNNPPFSSAVSDLYGSKCIFHDNQYIGYSSAMSNYSNATQYNNYYTTDGTSNTLVV